MRFECRVNYKGTVRNCCETGSGDTPEEALEKLKENLIDYKEDMDNNSNNFYSDDEKQLYSEINELIEDIDRILN